MMGVDSLLKIASLGSPFPCAVPPSDGGTGPISGFQRQATFRSLKLFLSIWSSGEYRVLIGSLFKYRHSPGFAATVSPAFASCPRTGNAPAMATDSTKMRELGNVNRDRVMLSSVSFLLRNRNVRRQSDLCFHAHRLKATPCTTSPLRPFPAPSHFGDV